MLEIDAEVVSNAEEYRRRKITSVLAIVFTDIANSTQLREELGEVRYEEMREDYESKFSAIVSRDDAGAIVKGTGDGAIVVFSEPSTAVERCLEVQDKLASHPLFKLRIGIDMGQVSVKSSFGIVADVFGNQVNRASRIQAMAQPNHVLASFHIYDCAVGWLKNQNVRWYNHGEYPIKGFVADISVHEVFDPRIQSPQKSPPRPEALKALFSRGISFSPKRHRETRPINLDQANLTLLFEELATRPLNIQTDSSAISADPYEYQASAIAMEVQALAECWPEIPSILWVEPSPQNKIRDHKALRRAGCLVDIAMSAEEAKQLLLRKRYCLIISSVWRVTNGAGGTELLFWRKNQKITTPIFLYGSASAVASYEEQAKLEGCTLCTAGVITLLNGISRCFEELRNRIPVEYVD